MKKIAYLFAIILLIISASRSFALKWGDVYWIVPPSDVPILNGVSFDRYFTDSKWPSLKYEIYKDWDFEDTNGEWVLAQWLQDHGWRRGPNGGWIRNSLSAINPIEGALYIDPYEKVAIYFRFNGDHSIFRVRVLKNG